MVEKYLVLVIQKTGWMFEKHGKPNLRTQMVYIEMYECVDVEVL